MSGERPRRRWLDRSPGWAGGGRCLVGIVCLGMLAAVRDLPGAQSPIPALPPKPTSARSVSGQFTVRVESSLSALSAGTNLNLIQLDPALVAVSCERMKQILSRELAATSPWRGRIAVTIYPAMTTKDPAAVASERYTDAWHYRVALPNLVDRALFVRTIVQAMLLEMANRWGPPRSAEIPTWLIEGFTEELLASGELQIVFAPPSVNANGLAVAPTFFDTQRRPPLARAHAVLAGRTPLTFDQLSWPPDLSGDAGEVFRANAQLFVDRLRNIDDEGRAKMCAFLAELPNHYNWQFALFRIYHANFTRPLDVEKWWALEANHFVGRDLSQAWTAQESWQKLAEALRSPVQIRSDVNALPTTGEVTLQTVIERWSSSLQADVLQQKLLLLSMMRLRLSEKFVPLADDYSALIRGYLRQSFQSGFAFPFRKKLSQKQLLDQTLSGLNTLDGRLAALRPVEMGDPLAKTLTDQK